MQGVATKLGLLFGLLLVVGLPTGCAGSRYIFQPVEQATAVLAGRTASHYAIPRAQPEGDARVTWLGVQDVHVPPGSKETIRALDVRLVLANNHQEAAWSFDTANQFLDIPGVGQIAVVLVSTDAPAAPAGGSLHGIPAGGKHTFDLYFPLPKNIKDVSDLPGFDVIWHVETSQGRVAERTPFERFRVEPASRPVYGYGFGAGFGPYWGYHSFWPRATFGYPGYYGHGYPVGRPRVAPRPR